MTMVPSPTETLVVTEYGKLRFRIEHLMRENKGLRDTIEHQQETIDRYRKQLDAVAVTLRKTTP